MTVCYFGDQCFGANCRYPRITADEVEAELDKMAAELEPILPPPAGEMMLQIMMVTFGV